MPICPISSLPKPPQVLDPPVVKSRGHTCIGRRRLGVLMVAARGRLTELYTFFSSGSCCCVAQARLKLTTFLIILNGRLTGRRMPPPGPAAPLYIYIYKIKTCYTPYRQFRKCPLHRLWVFLSGTFLPYWHMPIALAVWRAELPES